TISGSTSPLRPAQRNDHPRSRVAREGGGAMMRIRDLWRSWFIGTATIITIGTISSAAVAQTPSNALTTEAPSPSALNGSSLDFFPRDHLFRILGKDVLSATGENMGRIVDVLFDEKGEPHAAVVDFGGFLGVGTRKIAIGWGA